MGATCAKSVTYQGAKNFQVDEQLSPPCLPTESQRTHDFADLFDKALRPDHSALCLGR